jgi:hypothetical protein
VLRREREEVVRAEPVAALYEQGKVHHVGCFAALEDQLTSYVPQVSAGSPDRLDALVWGLAELMPPVRAIPGDIDWGGANEGLAGGGGGYYRQEREEGINVSLERPSPWRFGR